LDYWKQLREGIQSFHRAGGKNKAGLDDILKSVNNSKKIGRYSAAINGYKRFLGRRNIQWFDPLSGDWSYEGLSVKVNPELGLCIDGDRYLIKLYFKTEEPTKNRVQIVLEMMKTVLSAEVQQGAQMAVLDISNGRLLTQTAAIPQLIVLLEGEAAGFLRIWKAV
jgi:hypothetical protein